MTVGYARRMTAPSPSRSVSVPASLLMVAGRVERRLTDVLDEECERWAALDPDLVEPLHSLGRLVLAGGKRLRPAFCHWGFVGAGGDPDDPRIVEAGAAFELLQAFALVHDDVMDGSATRRGARTAHLEFADAHVDAAWRGERRRFGEGVAILIGDLAHVYADRFMANAPPEAIAVWNELRIELNIGQYLDVLGTARGDADLVRARRIARYKSGKYTIERPLHVGAAWPAGTSRCGRSCRATAIRSARRSSCATTCSARSATSAPPASRSVTTCARASRRRCWPSPSSGPRVTRPACSPRSAHPISARPRSRPCKPCSSTPGRWPRSS